MGSELPQPERLEDGPEYILQFSSDPLVNIFNALLRIDWRLGQLLKLERERREAEKILEAQLESLRPSNLTAQVKIESPELRSFVENLDAVPWDEGLLSDEEKARANLQAFLDDGWYRDDNRIYRFKDSDNPLPQDLIDAIHSPLGRRRKRVA